MKVNDIIKAFNKLAPSHYVYKWDNSGLQIGDVQKEVKKMLLALDITDSVIDEAIKGNFDMIITHHPFIFKPIKSIDMSTKKGTLIKKIINNDITIFSCHTNLDACKGGVNDVLAKLLDIEDIQILEEKQEKLMKFAVYVPSTHADDLKDKLGEIGVGHIGNYSYCSFQSSGIGSFMPNENTNPYIGVQNELQQVEEIKIETVMYKVDVPKVLDIIARYHPYEEPAYDIYELENKYVSHGVGRIGELPNIMTLEQVSHMLKDKLKSKSIRVYGDMNKPIRKVAVVGGSGADFIPLVAKKDVDVYITGDISYHDAQLANELGVTVIDAEHYYTEKVVLSMIKEYINSIDEKIIVSISNDDNSAAYHLV
ncbi:Nif3-like dinuclear metal center hexameric protein [Clostridiaceae bacterium M8S5]|nr:Nif3-like dinuclear metal center hexameric protein [Clostridiaceae bacterium M8S5]